MSKQKAEEIYKILTDPHRPQTSDERVHPRQWQSFEWADREGIINEDGIETT